MATTSGTVYDFSKTVYYLTIQMYFHFDDSLRFVLSLLWRLTKVTNFNISSECTSIILFIFHSICVITQYFVYFMLVFHTMTQPALPASHELWKQLNYALTLRIRHHIQSQGHVIYKFWLDLGPTMVFIKVPCGIVQGGRLNPAHHCGMTWCM